jgi:spore germination protein
MVDRKNKLLTQSQFTFLIVGMVLGPGFLRLPAIIVDKAKQDAWISIIIALVYPLCIILLSLYVINIPAILCYQ